FSDKMVLLIVLPIVRMPLRIDASGDIPARIIFMDESLAERVLHHGAAASGNGLKAGTTAREIRRANAASGLVEVVANFARAAGEMIGGNDRGDEIRVARVIVEIECCFVTERKRAPPIDQAMDALEVSC